MTPTPTFCLTDYEMLEEEELSRRSVKVVSTHDGVQKEVHYEALDHRGQKEVLTDLLVKSAVHYAMKKQQVGTSLQFPSLIHFNP